MDFYRELFDTLLSYLDEGIHVVDRDGKTIIYNKAMEKLEGLGRNEVLNKRLLEVFPSLNENTSTICKVLKTGESIPERFQSYINKKGYKIIAVNTTVPIKKDGELLGAVEVSKDFTTVKELYDKIIHLTGKGTNQSKNEGAFTFDNIVGCSPKFLKAVETAKRGSRSSSTVLIYGETGTGKEVFAKSIHNESERGDKPFVAVNCAALPEGLLEGILFGTVKGGFTGAINRPGLFEQANGGTLLLDEINSMDINLQAKLLRVLQEGCIRRVGDVKDIDIDVRIIATTNENPLEIIKSGDMRKDLFYRLSVINIEIPSLRERKEDISLFIKEFIKKYNLQLSKDVWDVSNDVYDAFMSYTWPGNIREIKNYIEGAMNMVTGHIIKKEHFTPQVQETLFDDIKIQNGIKENVSYGYDIPLDEYLDNIEKSVIVNALSKCRHNISEAARLLKIKRQTLQHKMKKYNIEF